MAKKTGQETIQVVLTKHAAWDSIPLRFGVDPKNRWGEIKGTKKKREKNGDEHYLGSLVLKSGQEIGSAEFVLAPRDGQDARQVKTVWTPDIQNYQDDTKLNKVMEFFRVAKVIDPKFTAQTLHPLYRDRKLKNFHSVSKEFEKIGLIVTSEQLENVEDDTLDKVQEKWGIEAEKREEARRQAISKAENELETRRKKNAGSNMTDQARTSPVGTLKNVVQEVRQNKSGKETLCTILTFEELPTERVMHAWADPDGIISEKARNLIGKKVITTVWNPADEPEKYAPLKWWRDIEEVPDGEE